MENFITYHTDVPYRVLEHRYGFDNNNPEADVPK